MATTRRFTQATGIELPDVYVRPKQVTSCQIFICADAARVEPVVSLMPGLLDGDRSEREILFETPLATDYDQALSSREIEINLVWSPADGATPLRLTRKPEPIVL